MRIRYEAAAVSDLDAMYDYISSKLNNPTAARRLYVETRNSIRRLKDNPFLGYSLSARLGLDTELRCLITSKQRLAFYEIKDSQEISIVRILDGRQDYLSVLFGGN